MACDDRQITQAQREAAYQQQRTGVVRAVRPFTGSPTIENLIDYINRELMPAVRDERRAINDVYLQVADNAPSANPLSFYFATAVTAGDPTVGRVKLNQAVQETATIVRVSQTNARLLDLLPWLDVMRGGVTTPLGVVTLVDAINPGRFIRFDLNTMTDQGAYWDLGVTVVESSHDNPFVEGEAVTLAFIPGVSAAGSTVPVGSLSPIAADTFLGNITTGTAAPAAVPLADIDSTSIIYDATSHTMQRAALTGFAASTQNSNATTSAEPIVTYSASANMSAERVTTSSTSITVSTSVASQIEFQRAALTGAIAASANANTTLFSGIRDNGSAETDRTNLNFLSSADVTLTVTDDAGSDELEITATIAAGTTQNEGTGGAVTLNAGVKVLAITTNISITGIARSGGNVDGDRFWIRCNDGIECTLEHATGTVANQFSLPYADDMIVPGRGMIEFRYESSWRAVSTGNKGRLLRRTAYDSGSGTHTYLSDCRRAIAKLVGGGGGGGGCEGGGVGVGGAAGGGGGSGAYLELDITDVPASSAYSVGALGTAGAASGGGNGGDGGDTTFHDGSATRTAAGGGGGGGDTLDAASHVGGDGGLQGAQPSATGAFLFSSGSPGERGMFFFLESIEQGWSGSGGSGPWGGGGLGRDDTEASGRNATGPGAGGGGAYTESTTDRAGGAGFEGIVIVEEYT